MPQITLVAAMLEFEPHTSFKLGPGQNVLVLGVLIQDTLTVCIGDVCTGLCSFSLMAMTNYMFPFANHCPQESDLAETGPNSLRYK